MEWGREGKKTLASTAGAVKWKKSYLRSAFHPQKAAPIRRAAAAARTGTKGAIQCRVPMRINAIKIPLTAPTLLVLPKS